MIRDCPKLKEPKKHGKHEDQKVVQCFSCGDLGHIKFDCPKNVSKKSKGDVSKNKDDELKDAKTISEMGDLEKMSKKQCYKCGIHGHFARDCPKDGSSQTDASNSSKDGLDRPKNKDDLDRPKNKDNSGHHIDAKKGCYICGVVGHFAYLCPKKDAPKNVQEKSWIGNTPVCYHCGKKNHFARDCWHSDKSLFCKTCKKEGHDTKDCFRKCHRCGKVGHRPQDCGTKTTGEKELKKVVSSTCRTEKQYSGNLLTQSSSRGLEFTMCYQEFCVIQQS